MIDRTLQRSLLESLAKCYPERDRGLLPDGDPDEKQKIANLVYLQEHELVESGLKQHLSGEYGFSGARITAKGLDFLQDDGGLTAILGTVTVKLHEETVREILKTRITGSALPPEEKSRLRKQIESLSSEALKVATKKLVEKGMESLPDAAIWIQGVLQSAA
jgi:hypothetical protein